MTIEELQAENEKLIKEKETKRIEYEAKLNEQRVIIQNLMEKTPEPEEPTQTAMDVEIEKINKRRKFR